MEEKQLYAQARAAAEEIIEKAGIIQEFMSLIAWRKKHGKL